MTDRELASGLNQTLLWVTQSSTPYLCRELIRWLNRRFQAFQVFFSKYLPGIPSEPIKLIAVEERRVPVQPITPLASPDQQTISVIPSAKWNKSQPAALSVAYVSFSQLNGQIMGKVLDCLGCQFVSIPNPMQALPCLLKHKSEVIFLDSNLSITNGYELCSQIRRVSIFSETPVIILTNCDNLLDRVRAKVVGSTDFLAKPIGLENVQAILLKHLSAQRFFSFKRHN
ncbi:MAG: response regulator [Leptolyngbyaceae cyanobacterium MO_188.B28]|nr:response regulator [Leptolyngbyaceae cyanobacterium MO_188.B28]